MLWGGGILSNCYSLSWSVWKFKFLHLKKPIRDRDNKVAENEKYVCT